MTSADGINGTHNGAAPDRFMSHIALWETDEVDWLEHVTDTEYTDPRRTARPHN